MAIGEGRGGEDDARRRRPHQLETLREIAIIESVGSSNAIEGIVAPPDRILALATKRSAPRDRPEQEIAGYRFVLDEIHEQALDIPFEPRYVLQLHAHLYRFTSVPHAGKFKTVDNRVTEQGPNGTVRLRFLPLPANRTPAAMEELHDRFSHAVGEGVVPYPLLCAAYVLDFLTIHPFLDGNGRMARLITLWLLYRGGYGVGRYISLEQIIDETKADYYATLGASTDDWLENRHDLLPWTRYLLGVIVAAYGDLAARIEALPPSPAGKRDAVRAFADRSGLSGFTAGEVLLAVPISRDHLGHVLRELRADGLLELRGVGRGARWYRVRRA